MNSMFEKAGISAFNSLVQNLILNIRFEQGEMSITTAVDYSGFTLDKQAEQLWDTTARKFLDKKEISYENIYYFDLLDSDSYDLSGVIVEIINNLSLYEELIKDIDFDKINDNELVRLLTVLSRKDNLYGISKSEDLELDNYKKLKKKY